MPTLTWIGKDKVINHYQSVPYCTLEKQYQYGNPDTENKIIHGDNLLALKALLPQYEGRIKCIYIDPPYNTGNENWVYNDNVNSPQIKKWLGQVVGKEGEDLSRHDKWLCMMYPRLQLLQKLLAEDGVIFISIDDNELANLKLICNEIFRENNFVALYKWNKTSTPPSLSNKVRGKYEYILCYEKSYSSIIYNGGLIEGGDMPLLNASNNIGQLIFPKEKVIFKISGKFSAGRYDKVELKNDIIIEKEHSNEDIVLEGHFKWTQKNLEEEIRQGTTFVIKSDKFSVRYVRKGERKKKPSDVISKEECGVGTNEDANKELMNIFSRNKVFNYPKPSSLIRYLINFVCNPNDIILDSFSGSGTTAHAVMELNKEDGGNRKFIMIEMGDYAETITAERVRRVINGYGEGKNENSGTGGGFSFYELGEPLMIGEYINEKQPKEKIQEYIWYTETRMPFVPPKYKYYLGKHQNVGYYFYYEKNKITTLGYDTLNIVKERADQYIIYADQCLISEDDLRTRSIIFKKIPRDIRKF